MKPFQHFVLCVVLLSVGCAGRLSAQEMDMYKSLLKESIDTNIISELKTPDISLSPFVSVRMLDAGKYALPETALDRNFTISPYATSWYTNVEGFDPTSTETAVDVVANGILTPIGALGTFNIFALAQYLMNIGVLPNEPFVSKEKKTAKRLREIKSIYNID